jgi:hypothetical protein
VSAVLRRHETASGAARKIVLIGGAIHNRKDNAMKRLLIAAAALAASAALAHANPLEGAFGNTVHITTPDGKTSKAYANADKTWERYFEDGTVLKGTYDWKDAETACFTQTDPPPKPDQQPACNKIEAHKVGDSWEVKNDKGEVTKFSMTAGR